MLATDFDIFTMREAFKAARRFMAAPAWSSFIVSETGLGAQAQTDDEIDEYIGNTCFTVNHVTCTVPMGKSGSVGSGRGALNADLTVKGTIGLRVVDASVFVSQVSSMLPMTCTYPPSWFASPSFQQRIRKSRHMSLPSVLLNSSKILTVVSPWRSSYLVFHLIIFAFSVS